MMQAHPHDIGSGCSHVEQQPCAAVLESLCALDNSAHSKSVRAVYEALTHLKHATVQEVMDTVNAMGLLKRSGKPTKVSLTSVYRALNHLVDDFTVKPLNFNDGQVRYELNVGTEHHHHFVCTQCKGIFELELCGLEAYQNALPEGFKVRYHTVELFGLCRTCG